MMSRDRWQVGRGEGILVSGAVYLKAVEVYCIMIYWLFPQYLSVW